MPSFDFENIRPYRDEEVHDIIVSLLDEQELTEQLPVLFKGKDMEQLKAYLLSLRTVDEFQIHVVAAWLEGLKKVATKGVEMDFTACPDERQAYMFITNHRDIVLDSAFLQTLLINRGMMLTEIAIGDNLLKRPWIKKLVRLNRSFIVERDLGVKEQMMSSMRLSAYIRTTLHERHRSIWIAQREGRAKDSNDRTQPALLKMMAMSDEGGDWAEGMKQLRFCPTAISYEYDPCDYLKAKEMQQRRDDAEWKKGPTDDLVSMKTGIFGWKGKVQYRMAGTLEKEIDEIAKATTRKNERINALAEVIDRKIHSNYELMVTHRVAHDIVTGERTFAGTYSEEEKAKFTEYVACQVSKVDLPCRDEEFLTSKIMEMYANPAINYLASKQ